jgi:hypothetical protein
MNYELLNSFRQMFALPFDISSFSNLERILELCLERPHLSHRHMCAESIPITAMQELF